MRLWHRDLIMFLPKKQLVGQWRECCAIMAGLAKNGTVKHPLVKKITHYSMNEFWAYTAFLYAELDHRGYNPRWSAFWNPYYKVTGGWIDIPDTIFKDWHNDRYLKQCLYNLQEKYDCGVISDEEWQKIIDRFEVE